MVFCTRARCGTRLELFCSKMKHLQKVGRFIILALRSSWNGWRELPRGMIPRSIAKVTQFSMSKSKVTLWKRHLSTRYCVWLDAPKLRMIISTHSVWIPRALDPERTIRGYSKLAWRALEKWVVVRGFLKLDPDTFVCSGHFNFNGTRVVCF